MQIRCNAMIHKMPNKFRKIVQEIKAGTRPDVQVYDAKLGNTLRWPEWHKVRESVDFSQTVVDGVETFNIRVTNRGVTDSWTYKTVKEFDDGLVLITYETLVAGPYHYAELRNFNFRTILLVGENHSSCEPRHVRRALTFPSIVLDVFKYDPRAKLFVEAHDNTRHGLYVGSSIHRVMDSVLRLCPERTFNYDIRQVYGHDPMMLLSKYEELMRPLAENNPVAIELVDEALVNAQRWIRQILPFSVDSGITSSPGYIYGHKYDHSAITLNEGINRFIVRGNYNPAYSMDVSDDTWDEYEGSLVRREHGNRHQPRELENLPGSHVYDIVKTRKINDIHRTVRDRKFRKAHNNREYWKAREMSGGGDHRQTLFSMYDSSSDTEDKDVDAYDAETEPESESGDLTDDRFNSDTTGIERPDYRASNINCNLDKILIRAFVDLTDLHLALLLNAEGSQISMAYVGGAHIEGISKYLRVIGSWKTISEKEEPNRDLVDMKFEFNVF